MFWYMLLAGSDSRIIAWILPRQGHIDGIIASDSRKHHLRVKTWGLLPARFLCSILWVRAVLLMKRLE
jgi:hypothetical protein